MNARLASIHRSAWKWNSANFACTEFSEVRQEQCSKGHRIHREFIAACFHQATYQPARERGVEISKARA
jgi:hypothetical protein